MKTLLRINWLNLKRDYVALGLTFVLPVIFFSIFAQIFSGMASGGGGSGEPDPLRILAVDNDQSETSRKLIEALHNTVELDVLTAPRATDEEPNPSPYDVSTARSLVRGGKYPAAIVIPEKFSEGFGNFASDQRPEIQVIYDPSNPMVLPTVSGMIQGTVMSAMPDTMMNLGMEALENFAGEDLPPVFNEALEDLAPFLRGERDWSEADNTDAGNEGDPNTQEEATDTTDSSAGFTGFIAVKGIVAQEDSGSKEGAGQVNMVAYYAAGIAVMFLLFSMTGAAGTLLEEEETGSLDRVLSTKVSMTSLLLSKWAFFGSLGFLQVVVMFVWGAIAFDLNLWTVNHLVGFVVMAMVTAAGASAFGLVLATVCRTRAQLGGISTIVILIMSALGGSMVPRFVAPFLEKTSVYTFNGQALNGFLAIFWHGAAEDSLATTLGSIAQPVGIVVAMMVVFLIIARLCARRWEAI